MFTVDLTRQFAVVDGDGEHDHFVQVHCELRYAPESALDALGSFGPWFFHDAGADSMSGSPRWKGICNHSWTSGPASSECTRMRCRPQRRWEAADAVWPVAWPRRRVAAALLASSQRGGDRSARVR